LKPPSRMKEGGGGTGADFAWALMQQQGWKQGDGLGARKQGMKDAIKPKLKFDHSGMGHNRKEEFEFHWWDHVFNSAAKGISVDETKGEVTVEFKTDKSEVSTKKLRRKMQKEIRSKLYSHFVKAATLRGGDMVEEKHEECLVEEVKDMSRTLSDDELVKACGGRTAHKGARHGQRMTAKLQRVADAEKLYLEQLLKRNQEKEAVKKAGKNGGINPGKEVKDAVALKDVVVVTDAKDAVERCKDASDPIDPAVSKKKKKKKSKHKDTAEAVVEEGDVEIKKKKRKREEDNQTILNPAAVVEAPEESLEQPVKKKKKKRPPLAEEMAAPEPTEEMAAPEPTEPEASRKKKKKRRKESPSGVCDSMPSDICSADHLNDGAEESKQKRKKSKKAS